MAKEFTPHKDCSFPEYCGNVEIGLCMQASLIRNEMTNHTLGLPDLLKDVFESSMLTCSSREATEARIEAEKILKLR